MSVQKIRLGRAGATKPARSVATRSGDGVPAFEIRGRETELRH